MNEKNLDYLKEHLKFMGFGENENLHAQLRARIEEGAANFSLTVEQNYDTRYTMVCDLHFRRGDQQEMYFFNAYDATLRTETGALSHKFYLQQNGKGITLKEAFNLLSGRAVQKMLTDSKGQTYRAWQQLDVAGPKEENGNYKIKQFHENYGFDLRSSLSKAGVRELSDENSAMQVLRSVERGNLQSVSVEIGGQVINAFVSANPQYKTINMYDQNLKPIRQTIGADQSVKDESRGVSSSGEQYVRSVTGDKFLSDANDKKKDQSVKPLTDITQTGKKEVKKNSELLPRKAKTKNKGLSM